MLFMAIPLGAFLGDGGSELVPDDGLVTPTLLDDRRRRIGAFVKRGGVGRLR